MNNILIVLGVATIVFLLERLRPANQLDKVRRWYVRAFVLNCLQALIALNSSLFLDEQFAQFNLFALQSQFLVFEVIAGYLTITFIYYWWHRFRHSVPFLWRNLHQLHHSPVRLEVVTSFYKHPLEMLVNSIISSTILYFLLGVSANAAALCVLITGLAELIYHMNIKTPHLMGLFFQRPEMHRIHHQRGLHHYNFSDLPVWDMLFGTYKNPVEVSNKVGFPEHGEQNLKALLTGKELQS